MTLDAPAPSLLRPDGALAHPVTTARAALVAAREAAPDQCDHCLPLAHALGVALRRAMVEPRAARLILSDAVGHVAPARVVDHTMGHVPELPSQRLLSRGVDGYYGL